MSCVYIYICIYYYLRIQCVDYVSFDIWLPIVPSVEDVAGIVSLESGGVYIDAFKRSVSMSSCNIEYTMRSIYGISAASRIYG